MLFLLLYDGRKNEGEILRKHIKILAVTGVLIFTVQVGQPIDRLVSFPILTFPRLTVPKITVTLDEVYGSRPIEGDQCWIEQECTPYDRPAKSILWGHSAFYRN